MPSEKMIGSVRYLVVIFDDTVANITPCVSIVSAPSQASSIDVIPADV